MLLNRMLMSGKRAINIDDYLTITALEDDLQASLTISDCQYCVDGSGSWIDLPAETQTVAVNKGQTLSFRAYITETICDESGCRFGIGTFSVSKRFNLSGNSMSMCYGHIAKLKREMPLYLYDAFYRLFANNVTLERVSRNFLPATKASYGCYMNMFEGCTSLIQPPAINLEKIPEQGCQAMFYGCSSLGSIAEMPAHTIGNYGCSRMYYGCTSLYYAYELPAVNLGRECYSNMFAKTALYYIPELPATTLAEDCYAYMFYQAELTLQNSLHEITLPATTLARGCYSGMFAGSGIVTAPHLPAPKLVLNCYSYMFEDCVRLCRITMLAIEREGEGMDSWTNNVSSEGIFTKNAAAPSWVDYYIPEGWTVEEVAV